MPLLIVKHSNLPYDLPVLEKREQKEYFSNCVKAKLLLLIPLTLDDK